MFNFKKIVQHALLAVSLFVSANAAFAGPTYQVNLNTAAYAGTTGLIDFSFINGSDNAVGAIATMSNFVGDFGTQYDRFGNVTGTPPATVTFVNDNGWNYLTQAVTFGGNFVFNISFSGDFETLGGAVGSTFAVSLFTDELAEFLAQPVQFSLVPSFDDQAAFIDIGIDETLATVTEVAVSVPEPSQLLLLLTALAMMGAIARRKHLG